MRLQCNGEIVDSGDKWLYDYFGIPAFAPQSLREAIDKLAEGEELTLEINSPGGNCYAGFETYALLRGCGHPTVAEVQGVAASAASIILMGCNRRRVSPAGMVMIHDPWLCARGNAESLRGAAKYLDSVKASILNAYELGCRDKCSRARLGELMHEETWLPAQDAVTLGLCDEVILLEGEEAEGKLPTTAASGAMNGVGCHSAEDLMERYRAEVKAGRTPAEGHPADTAEAEGGAPQTEAQEASRAEEELHEPTAQGAENHTGWRENARLNIEKERFWR